jgi:menaquinone-dependent protoporphyrinogen IX oxidase
MTGVIIYKSTYGATRTNAGWLAEDLSFPVHEAGPAALDAARSADVVIACAVSVFHFDGKMKFGELDSLHRTMMNLISKVSKDPHLQLIRTEGHDRMSREQIAPQVAWATAA